MVIYRVVEEYTGDHGETIQEPIAAFQTKDDATLCVGGWPGRSIVQDVVHASYKEYEVILVEKTKQRALQKLTAGEKKALGLAE